jgi:hypothetical protein
MLDLPDPLGPTIPMTSVPLSSRRTASATIRSRPKKSLLSASPNARRPLNGLVRGAGDDGSADHSADR